MNPTRKCQYTGSTSRLGCCKAWPAFKFWGIILISIIILSIFYLPVFKRFTVIEEKTGKVLFYTDISNGDVFSVKYIHSVNKSPIEDVFEIEQNDGIKLIKTVFHSFGAGVPCELEPGQILISKEDRMEITNINKHIDRYLLKVGTVANHTLCIQGREFLLDHLAAPKQTIRLEVRRIPVYYILKGVNAYERK